MSWRVGLLKLDHLWT